MGSAAKELEGQDQLPATGSLCKEWIDTEGLFIDSICFSEITGKSAEWYVRQYRHLIEFAQRWNAFQEGLREDHS